MRFYEDSELLRQKCWFCGSKNKLVTDILLKKEKVGYSVRCCNCGHIDDHIFPWDDTKNTKQYLDKKTKLGTATCMQSSFCPYKNCPHYNPKKEENDNNFVCTGNCKSCIHCKDCRPNLCEPPIENKIPDLAQLVSKTCNGPEYK